MYLEVKDLKKSYGEGGGYVQVLKGITAGVEQGEMCASRAPAVPANPRCSTASEDWIPWLPVPS